MQLRSTYQKTKFEPELAKALTAYRFHRNFNAVACLEAKSTLINHYFTRYGLTAAVVAVSGGIDSAVTLALVAHASRAIGSPIKKILPVTLPVFTTNGVTGQHEAAHLAALAARACGTEPYTIDLSTSFQTLRTAIESATGRTGEAWAQGQLAPYLRTPTLYYLTSLLTQEGIPAVVCGTTNRDEGAYLGFFGKASDGMVDLQLIADLHKSEVYALGKTLGVPDEIMRRTPTGDMFDSAPDTEVFGAPYDFVELYLHFLTMTQTDKDRFLLELSPAAHDQFIHWQNNLEKLHEYNAHKYLVGSPAAHLNIYESGVPGGWTEPQSAPTNSVNKTLFVNEHALPPELLTIFSKSSHTPSATPLNHPTGYVSNVHNILSRDECQALQKFFATKPWTPVGVNGIYKDFNPEKDEVGSYRLSWYSPELATILWQRLQGQVPMVRTFSAATNPENEGYQVWRAVGVNELFRGITYEPGGWLLPHYDAPYHYNDTKRTTLSLVIYLSDTEEHGGGSTRFLHDPKIGTHHNYADWKKPPQPHDILTSVSPRAGNALLFEHRLLHDGEQVVGKKSKIIIRTDIVYELISARYA